MTDRQIKDALRGARFIDIETNSDNNAASIRFDLVESTLELKVDIIENYPPHFEFTIRKR
jgi:hypothetical protein